MLSLLAAGQSTTIEKKFKYGEMIYQVTIVLFSIWSQFMVALEYFFDVKVIRVCFVDLG